jgi:hypothetical protein
MHYRPHYWHHFMAARLTLARPRLIAIKTMMQALRRQEPKAPPAPRRKAAKVYRVIR